MSLGVHLKTAVRWLDQADGDFMYGDDEFFPDRPVVMNTLWVGRVEVKLISVNAFKFGEAKS